MSGFGFGTRSGLHRLGHAASDPLVTISAFAVSEAAQPGSTVGALSVVGGNGPYVFAIPPGGDPDSKFAVNGSNLDLSGALDFETSSSHQVTIEADNGVDPALSRTLIIGVTNAFEQPDLGPLSIAEPVTQGTTAPITGATDGSSIAAVLLPNGWTFDGPGRQITIAGDAPTGPQSWLFIETLADSANSPRVTAGSAFVAPASGASFDPVEAGLILFDSRDIPQNGPVSSWEAKGARATVSNNSVSEQPLKSSAGVSFDGNDDILTDSGRRFGVPSARYNIDAVWNASPLGDAEQFTNTGIDRAPDGTWWLVNHPAGSASRSDGILVHFSADFSTVLATIDLGAVYGIGTIGGPQGLVYDTDDGTLWFTSALMDEVKHIQTDGTPLPADDIAFPNPAGLAIDQAQGALIILESEGSAADQSAGIMRTVNKSTGATIASGTLTDHPDWDQIYFDQESRALFVTGGYEYAGLGDTYVSIYSMDGPDYLRQLSFIRTPEPDAIEGIVYSDGRLYINNDAGFHGGASGVNEVVEYDVGQIVGSKILFAGVLQVQGNSGTDVVIALDFPISNGDYGHAVLLGGSTDIRLFNRSGPTDENTNATFATDTPNLGATKRLVTGVFDPAAATEVRMWIDGSEVTGAVTGGAQDSYTGPVTDRVNLAIGGSLDGNSALRQAQIDVDAIGYGVRTSIESDVREEIEGWLAHEFGLTSQLPMDHPYKATPP